MMGGTWEALSIIRRCEADPTDLLPRSEAGGGAAYAAAYGREPDAAVLLWLCIWCTLNWCMTAASAADVPPSEEIRLISCLVPQPSCSVSQPS